MEYLTSAEFSEKWEISSRMIACYCQTKRIDGAVKKGKVWLIPAGSEKPSDKRFSKTKIAIQEDSDLQGDLQRINKADVDNSSIIYHANELYKNLNITRDTLRYYEEIGLILPERNEKSQYREFTFSDISHLMAIDFYRKRGFSPFEIKKLMQNRNNSGRMQYLEQKAADIEQNILAQQRILSRLKRTKKFYEFYRTAKGKFYIKMLPLYLVTESLKSVSSFNEYQTHVLNYLDLQHEDILSSLVRAVTFDSSGYRGTQMCIARLAAEQSPLPDQVYLECGKCLYTTIDADSCDNSIMEDMFVSCHKWAELHKMEFKGVVYIFIRLVEFDLESERNFYEIWIPLK
jgi:DNA-binding transcriptional MerR regulator